MERARPGPGEELTEGEPVVPRPAATVMLLRGGAQALEVLLVQRTPAARFMGGAWVFPGGAVERGEGDGQAALRAAAVRELREEAGVELPPGAELVPFARWITPARVTIRFDTWFYLASAPPGVRPEPDGREVVEARWYAPEAALEAGRQGEILLVFPTIKQLEQLAGFASAEALLAHARGSEVHPVEPRVIGAAQEARIVLPGEPGYEAG
jgi:8-oxo-dGTP pyrophosphatase MutT (NUDIX family)